MSTKKLLPIPASKLEGRKMFQIRMRSSWRSSRIPAASTQRWSQQSWQIWTFLATENCLASLDTNGFHDIHIAAKYLPRKKHDLQPLSKLVKYTYTHIINLFGSKPGTPGGPKGSNLAPGGTPLQLHRLMSPLKDANMLMKFRFLLNTWKQLLQDNQDLHVSYNVNVRYVLHQWTSTTFNIMWYMMSPVYMHQ